MSVISKTRLPPINKPFDTTNLISPPLLLIAFEYFIIGCCANGVFFGFESDLNKTSGYV